MLFTFIKFFSKLKMSYFCQNGKPTALLFGENRSYLDAFYIHKIFSKLKMSYFGQNGKPIALLFGENWSFLNTFYIHKIFLLS